MAYFRCELLVSGSVSFIATLFFAGEFGYVYSRIHRSERPQHQGPWGRPTHPLMSKKNTLIAQIIFKKNAVFKKTNSLVYLSVLHRDCL